MSGKSSAKSLHADDFLLSFAKARAFILKRIETLEDEPINELNSKFTILSNDIQEINSSLNEATNFLPQFLLKKRQDEIRELEKALRKKEELLLPKKKFGFKKSKFHDSSKVEAKRDVLKGNGSVLTENNLETSLQTELHENRKDETNDQSKTEINLVQLKDSNHVTIEEHQNMMLTYDEDVLNKNDVLLRNVKNCILYLNGAPSTLRLINLRNCKLICGPVFTSVFIEECSDSIFFLCCQQLRLHSSKSLDIYLRVRSRAIIEDSSGIRFGPYVWNNPKSSRLHQITQINENIQRFDAIDDFNWLAFSSPSPNWSLIPSNEQITEIYN